MSNFPCTYQWRLVSRDAISSSLQQSLMLPLPSRQNGCSHCRNILATGPEMSSSMCQAVDIVVKTLTVDLHEPNLVLIDGVLWPLTELDGIDGV